MSLVTYNYNNTILCGIKFINIILDVWIIQYFNLYYFVNRHTHIYILIIIS